MESAESLRELGLPRHNLNFSSSVAVNPPERADEAAFLAAIVDDLNAAYAVVEVVGLDWMFDLMSLIGTSSVLLTR